MRMVRTILFAFALIMMLAFTASASTITFQWTGVGSGFIYHFDLLDPNQVDVDGTFGVSTPFGADVDFTITAKGDDALVGSCLNGPPCFSVLNTSASITVGSAATDGVYDANGNNLGPQNLILTPGSTQTQMANEGTQANPTPGTINLVRAPHTGLIVQDLYDTNFKVGPWDMQSSFPASGTPISGSFNLVDWDDSPQIMIDSGIFAGDFIHFDPETVPGTFLATVTPGGNNGGGNNGGSNGGNNGGGNPVPEPGASLVLSLGAVALLLNRFRVIA